MVGSFVPVTLEQLAREGGVLWSDKTTPCVAKTAGKGAAALAARLLTRAASPDNNQCVVRVFGAELTTSSFAMYTFSLAVFTQALALVSFSSIADHGKIASFISTSGSDQFQQPTGRSFLLHSGLQAPSRPCCSSSSCPRSSSLDPS